MGNVRKKRRKGTLAQARSDVLVIKCVWEWDRKLLFIFFAITRVLFVRRSRCCGDARRPRPCSHSHAGHPGTAHSQPHTEVCATQACSVHHLRNLGIECPTPVFKERRQKSNDGCVELEITSSSLARVLLAPRATAHSLTSIP